VLAKATRLPNDIFSVIKRNDTAALNRLIFKGFDIDLVDVLEGAPIHCAVEHGSVECLKILIENGADLNCRSIQKSETPVQIAVRVRNRVIYDILTSHDVDLTLRNKDGETALFYAVRNNDEALIDDLVKRGVDVNDRNDCGVTPLYVAVSLKKPRLVKKLLEHKADPKSEIHPSFKLAKEMENEELTALLGELGAASADIRGTRVAAHKGRARPGRKVKVVEEEVEEEVKHTEGFCYVCERNRASQKLIPCGHVVSCRGCIKRFIEDQPPCPECNLKFYATATLPEFLED
jgi:ankyrin repeat protein